MKSVHEGTTLSSGVVLTKADVEEIQRKLWDQDDIDEVYETLNSGIFDDDLIFGEIPDVEIPKIAKQKSYYQYQKSYSWDQAAEEAIRNWRHEQYNELLDELWSSYPQYSKEEFENDPNLFRSREFVRGVLDNERFLVWKAVVPASEGEE